MFACDHACACVRVFHCDLESVECEISAEVLELHVLHFRESDTRRDRCGNQTSRNKLHATGKALDHTQPRERELQNKRGRDGG
jgi:hypothetical protein